MIIVTISGPQGSGKSQTVSELYNWLILSRKVVKKFSEENVPDPLPTNCDVIIIEKQTQE